MRQAALWAFGILGSLAAHVVLFLTLNLAVEPDEVVSQPAPETRMTMDAYQVDQSKAEAKLTGGDRIDTKDTEAPSLPNSTIPHSTANAVSASTSITPAGAPQPVALSPTQSSDPALPAAAFQSTALVETRPNPETTNAITSEPDVSQVVRPTLQTANPVTKPSLPTNALRPPLQVAGSVTADWNRTEAVRPEMQSTKAVAAVMQQTVAVPDLPLVQTALVKAPTVPGKSAAPNSRPIDPKAVAAPAAVQAALQSAVAKAEPAWQFGNRIVTDPKSLAVIQALLAPQNLSGPDAPTTDVRDGLSALLTGVECARLSATFVPETGHLEMRGHVPDDATKIPVLNALQAQVGDGIVVTDNLMVLPPPQCSALSGIANAGLPQSTDQFTNPLLIGANAQAKTYSYFEGQRLQLEMTTPDYEAVIYVDYFSANNEVFHLIPNDAIPLKRMAPKSVFGIGTQAPGAPGLNVTIGPPFGQEIAVAIAASDPLFDTMRPLTEPADDYLAALASAIAAARERNPDFKGEWVYFFINTSPAL
jgi:hypothetical protein